MSNDPEEEMSASGEQREEGNSSQRAILGVLAIVAFVAAIICLVLFVIFA